MVSHEYGSQTFRPHHHAIIFGFNPPDQEKIGSGKKGDPLFRSDFISDLWSYGFHSIGSANEKTAYYIAAYALKGRKHDIELPTGEIATVADQFDCSRSPSIGLLYLAKNYKQIINSNETIPRAYHKKLIQLSDPDYCSKFNHKYKTNVDHNDVFEFVSLLEFNQNTSLTSRSTQERLAKLKNVNSDLSSSEFRSCSTDYQKNIDYINYLKGTTIIERDNLLWRNK